MTLENREITVAGGGVAGLAAARALALRGARVRLFEQADAISEVGAGLQISPNGMRVIDALGLGAELRAVSKRAEAVVLRDAARGRVVSRLPLGPVGEFRLVHRARLIEVLESGARAAGVRLVLGRRLEPRAETEPPIGLVVAADGLRSPHRAALNGQGAPFFTGQVAWRALIAEGHAAPEAHVFMAPGRHLVSYPLGGGLRNIVAVEERGEWTAEGWSQTDDPERLRRAFAGFGGPVPGWLAEVEEVALWGLFRHEVAPRWQRPGLVLAGDAAHPTLPFLAQGANMALEDAWVLADRLARLPEAEALAAYEAERRARTARIVAAANANARAYHLGGAARVLAHAGLRLAGAVAPGLPLRRLRWLYDYDATI